MQFTKQKHISSDKFSSLPSAPSTSLKYTPPWSLPPPQNWKICAAAAALKTRGVKFLLWYIEQKESGMQGEDCHFDTVSITWKVSSWGEVLIDLVHTAQISVAMFLPCHNLGRKWQRELQQTLWLSHLSFWSIFHACPGVNSHAILWILPLNYGSGTYSYII